jgi:DNA-binding NarL/FixJ family response regulator
METDRAGFGDGLATLRIIRRPTPLVPIMIFRMFDEWQVGPLTWEVGATGFVNKAASRAILSSAIKTLLAGQEVFQAALLKN